MKVGELDISPKLAAALENEGFIELHPPQGEALPVALSGKNLVAAIPTASGKSLIGFIPAMEMVLTKRRKVLYIVPLKALASEKRDDLEKFSHLGFKVKMSTGDLDTDDNLSEADIIIATSEKADSMIRHKSKWLESIGMVIADEVHMIHDPGRGPTLEIALTKLIRRTKDLQIIALSATVSNAEDLADWLDAELIKSDWRPIPLKEGVYFNGEVTFEDLSSIDVPVSKEVPWDLVRQTVETGGQCLIFVNTRRSTESLAVKYSKKMKEFCGEGFTEKELDSLKGGIESTALGNKLAECVANGMAFHNAGLTYKQRRFVEDNFKNRRIKCIVATPTLAAGINLPARRVIVRDTYRFESNSGNVPLPVMEVKQMCGRAGRPGYDPYGESVLIGKTYEDYEHLMDDYVMKETERLTSKLGNEMTLRGHILGLIATGDADSEESVVEFMRETFFGSTSQLYGIEGVVERVADFLSEEGMIQREGELLRILPFGKRVSDLYIDPKSAVIMRDAVRNMTETTDPFLILHAIASTPDVLGLYPKKCDETRLSVAMSKYNDEFLVEDDDMDEMYFDSFKSDLKTALLLSDWINEVSEEGITDGMGIGPGDIRTRVDMADWMLYSLKEIAFIFKPDVVKIINILLTRVRYGVKEELLELVSFRGVGRARARILFNFGLYTRMDVITANHDELARISGIGPALAKSLKAQSGGGSIEEKRAPSYTEQDEEDLDRMAEEYAKVKGTAPEEPKQSNLFDFH